MVWVLIRIHRKLNDWTACISVVNLNKTSEIPYFSLPYNSFKQYPLTDNIRLGQICHDSNTIFFSNDLILTGNLPGFINNWYKSVNQTVPFSL